eukprot:CAMPEP_0205854614 /NCGR_PEP_ID=MMETSP1083-20121108/2173_1 /ASSEMBLY_ACC=CAM_ASM_000430 /TAXON_ID=97485 /ORGANISM="Prymnesium parvum, Strain Texoma1" /LENGTH=210 /DNA_ID=CAMNT_0053215949 /DNA_START=726 /DNA_END=1359 /DNA_ORIENTATION=+
MRTAVNSVLHNVLLVPRPLMLRSYDLPNASVVDIILICVRAQHGSTARGDVDQEVLLAESEDDGRGGCDNSRRVQGFRLIGSAMLPVQAEVKQRQLAEVAVRLHAAEFDRREAASNGWAPYSGKTHPLEDAALPASDEIEEFGGLPLAYDDLVALVQSTVQTKSETFAFNRSPLSEEEDILEEAHFEPEVTLLSGPENSAVVLRVQRKHD